MCDECLNDCEDRMFEDVDYDPPDDYNLINTNLPQSPEDCKHKIEIESSDPSFLCKLLDFLKSAEIKPGTTTLVIKN